MVDIKNLNRVKGILSAKQGAEIPKFQQGAKFAMYNGKQIIYSSDRSSWFNDESLTSAYTGNLNGFKSVQYDPKTPKNPIQPTSPLTSNTVVPTEVPGDQNITPQTAIESAVIHNNKVQEKAEEAKINTQVTPEVTSQQSSAGMSLQDPVTVQPEKKQLEDTFKQKELQEQTAVAAKVTPALNAVSALGYGFNAKQQATNSELTNTADAVWDVTATGLSSLGPAGQVVGAGMEALKTIGNIGKELTGGTDQMTKTDKWMDSAWLSWNVGLINSSGGKTTQNFSADSNVLASVGSSYGGAVSDINDAVSKAGKKYGKFSEDERKAADRAINEARKTQAKMASISRSATDQRLAVQSMGEQAGLAYQMMASGGYNQKYTYAAKHGGSLEWNPVIEVEWEPQIELNWELPTFKEGGNVDINEELEQIPAFQSGNKINLDEVRKYYKDYDLSDVEFIMDENPRTEGNKLYIRNEEDAVHELWHYLSNNRPNEIYKDYYDKLDDDRIIELGGDLNFVKVFEENPQIFYDPSELEARIKAAKFKTKGQTYTKEFFQNLRNDEMKYGYNMRDLLYMYNDDNLVKIFSLKRGGSVGDSDVPEIEETTQKNVIPEGALHKNKHHMEHAEGLTKKGIPVIDDDGEQQAEIEHSEIIFTLEVTKKLEEYYEIFYSDETTNKEKEQAALDAGKLLVYQILENTEDRTGLIESCKKGGSLTLKKNTDDLIEEVLEWMPTIIIIEEKEENNSKKDTKEKPEKEKMKEAIKEVLIELLTS